ncbi:PP2C family protein-serine/threonine phosphatase [Dactylosporangium sp. NPDC049140]|uniref:PP2C family protein-serine/threonine phosphatase n=1 Tax=Dactylosporangium sp. NPDC049140 TaxID=3155647 RepID=UPI00340BAA38
MGVTEALLRLLTAAHRAVPEDLPALATEGVRLVGALDADIFLIDYRQSYLVPLTAVDAPTAAAVPVEGTLAGRAFAYTELCEAPEDGGYRMWVPLLDGTERLGVIAVHTAAEPTDRLRDDCRHIASALAELLMTRRHYGDGVERTRRLEPMQLAAEILWNLLPPLTFVSHAVSVSAILEPCYDVGGDAFDYAINGNVLHVAVFDSVGHGIEASDTTSLAINAYRNARRTGLDLADTCRSIDTWLSARHPGNWVTALLLELDTVTGLARRISAGHPGELLLRQGKAVKSLPAPTAMPLGLRRLADREPEVTQEQLQPGDQLLLYTDGVVEARTADGEFFGLDRLGDYVTRALADRLPAPETMRRLVHAILTHQNDRLQDDATAVLVEWRPTAAPTADLLPRVE